METAWKRNRTRSLVERARPAVVTFSMALSLFAPSCAQDTAVTEVGLSPAGPLVDNDSPASIDDANGGQIEGSPTVIPIPTVVLLPAQPDADDTADDTANVQVDDRAGPDPDGDPDGSATGGEPTGSELAGIDTDGVTDNDRDSNTDSDSAVADDSAVAESPSHTDDNSDTGTDDSDASSAFGSDSANSEALTTATNQPAVASAVVATRPSSSLAQTTRLLDSAASSTWVYADPVSGLELARGGTNGDLTSVTVGDISVVQRRSSPGAIVVRRANGPWQWIWDYVANGGDAARVRRIARTTIGFGELELINRASEQSYIGNGVAIDSRSLATAGWSEFLDLSSPTPFPVVVTATQQGLTVDLAAGVPTAVGGFAANRVDVAYSPGIAVNDFPQGDVSIGFDLLHQCTRKTGDPYLDPVSCDESHVRQRFANVLGPAAGAGDLDTQCSRMLWALISPTFPDYVVASVQGESGDVLGEAWCTATFNRPVTGEIGPALRVA